MSSMVAFIPASGDDRSLFRLEPANESPVSVVTVPCEKFQSSKLSADRSTFVTAHGDDETPTTVRVYDLPGGTLRRTISFPDRRGSFCPRDTLVACMSWHLSGDGKTLYMAEAWDGTKRITPAGIDVIDTVTGALVRRIDVSARTIARAPSPPLLLQSDDVGVYFLSPFCGDDGLRFDLSRRGRSFEVGAGSAPTTTTNIV